MANVEIILIREEKGLGKLGQKKRVKLGYFSNYLLPNGMALLATKGNQDRFKLLEKKEQKRLTLLKNAAEKVQATINGKTIVIAVASKETGKLYGAVTPTSIAHHILHDLKVEVAARLLELSAPIKELGEFAVKIILHPEVQIAITVQVVKEEKEVAKDA